MIDVVGDLAMSVALICIVVSQWLQGRSLRAHWRLLEAHQQWLQAMSMRMVWTDPEVRDQFLRLLEAQDEEEKRRG